MNKPILYYQYNPELSSLIKNNVKNMKTFKNKNIKNNQQNFFLNLNISNSFVPFFSSNQFTNMKDKNFIKQKNNLSIMQKMPIAIIVKFLI